jgi:hypothetical protein
MITLSQIILFLFTNPKRMEAKTLWCEEEEDTEKDDSNEEDNEEKKDDGGRRIQSLLRW